MKHVDLFSGIGGFALACEWAGIETICFCEIDKFCQKILNKHWPGVPIIEDVNDVEAIKVVADSATEGLQEPQHYKRSHTTDEAENRTGLDNRPKRPNSIILTAGFPCQPFSNAGRKRGANDNRYLWPATLKVIESVKPTYVILENVAGLLNMVFPDSVSQVASQATLFGTQDEEIRDYETICGRIESDLRQAGYETVWLLIPACSVGAPHRRDRVWIVGTNVDNSELLGYRKYSTSTTEPNSDGSQDGLPEPRDCDATHASNEGLQGCESTDRTRLSRQSRRDGSDQRGAWSENWYEVATRLCTLDDGLPGGLARPKGWRVNALKATGNAIVPQVAYEILLSLGI